MKPSEINETYWAERWQNNETQWDVGKITTPLKQYIDGLSNKSIRILIPGAGNGYEGIYLLEHGFTNVTLLDISDKPIENLKKILPKKWHSHIVKGDFFMLNEKYDLILEQTFFCAIHPDWRKEYVKKTEELLSENGVLAGVLFDANFDQPFPPFGGNLEEYESLFFTFFEGKIEKCYNSIKPRINRELFIILKKRRNKEITVN